MRICPPIPRFAAVMFGAVAAFGGVFHAPPALAVDQVPFACNGVSGTQCNLFQLDGSNAANGAADTCVGSESTCAALTQNPVWPADWDALLFPSLTSASPAIVPTTGTPPGAWTFALPWGGFGSFSGVFSSTLVTTGTSTILKQGTKNTDDLSKWVVASQQSPPKDAYLAAALATYTGPTGSAYALDQLLYFGSTRFSANGSATIGIWFFQQNVTVCGSGPNAGKAMCVDGTTTLASHKQGDLFLFITFGGNGKAAIQASTWQGGDGTAGSLLPAPGSIAVCPSANDDTCAVTNENNSFTLGTPTGFQAPGVGFNVSGPGFAGFPNGVVPALQFQEGGIDLNSIFNGAPPCFSSVMFASITSGSSPNTASMKSILLGSFNTCAIAVNKTCGAGTPDTVAGTVTYAISGAVTNTGGGAVKGLTLQDVFQSSSVAINSQGGSCGTGCTITGTDYSTITLQPGGVFNYTGSITSTNNGGSNVITATMGGVGGGAAQATSLPATCQPVSLSDSITVTKACTTSLAVTTNGLVVQVKASGTVKNTSDAGLTLTNVTVTDCHGGSFATAGDPNSCTGTKTATVLATGGSTLAANATTTYSETFTPLSLPSDAGTNACPNGTFSDTVMVTASCTSAFCNKSSVFNTASQSCPLCPLNQTQ